MAINPVGAGRTPPQGPGVVGAPGARAGQNQIVQQLRQMDHEQLVMLAMQLITRLRQLESARGQMSQQQQPMG